MSKSSLQNTRAISRNRLQPKKELISLDVVFKAEDVPKLPDQTKQKHYCSFVAKLHFAATWILFDISFAVMHLAHFCAWAGQAQWAALHHLMEYLAVHPSFKIKYSRGTKLIDLLSGYADADWGNSSSSTGPADRRPAWSRCITSC